MFGRRGVAPAARWRRSSSVPPQLLEPDVRLLKLNADEAPNVSARLGVRGIPAMYLFRHGSVLAQTAGAMNADAIVRWVRNHLASQPP